MSAWTKSIVFACAACSMLGNLAKRCIRWRGVTWLWWVDRWVCQDQSFAKKCTGSTSLTKSQPKSNSPFETKMLKELLQKYNHLKLSWEKSVDQSSVSKGSSGYALPCTQTPVMVVTGRSVIRNYRSLENYCWVKWMTKTTRKYSRYDMRTSLEYSNDMSIVWMIVNKSTLGRGWTGGCRIHQVRRALLVANFSQIDFWPWTGWNACFALNIPKTRIWCAPLAATPCTRYMCSWTTLQNSLSLVSQFKETNKRSGKSLTMHSYD